MEYYIPFGEVTINDIILTLFVVCVCLVCHKLCVSRVVCVS